MKQKLCEKKMWTKEYDFGTVKVYIEEEYRALKKGKMYYVLPLFYLLTHSWPQVYP